MLSIRLPEDIENRLNALSQETGRSKSYYARAAILEKIEDMEDVYIAEKRLEDLRAGRSQTISSADMRKELGLDE